MSNLKWKSVTLGDVTNESRTRANNNAQLLARPVYGVDRSIGLTSVAKYTASNLERYKILEHGMFAYNPMRLNIGSIGYCSRDIQPGLVSPDYVVFECNPKYLNPDFLSYYISSPSWKEWTASAGVGSVRMRIYYKEIARIPLLLPSIPEQSAIVEVLRALDDKIELNSRMNQTLEFMARTLFRQWFVENDEIESWKTAILNDLAKSVFGGDWGKDTNEDGDMLPAFCIRGADIPDLQSGGIGKMPLRYLKPSSLEKRKLQDGDIVVEISGGSPTQSTGRPVFISNTLLNRLERPLVASNFCRVFRPKDAIVSNFVYFWLRYLYSRDEFFQFENGTTGIKNFAFTNFCEHYTLRLPPKDMLEHFQQLTSPIFEAMQSNAKEAGTLASLSNTLLPKLMQGEVRVKV